MSGQDKTGPLGQGPMTGKGMGPCGGGMQREFGKGCRRSFGRGFGRGMSFGNRESVALTAEEQKKVLESELKEMDSEKEAIKKKLSELA